MPNTQPLASRTIHREKNLEFLSNEEEYVPNEPNRIESLNIWKVKRQLKVKKFHLIICYASNEKGNSYSTKIVIPSDIGEQKTYDVVSELERLDDNDIVEGDDFSIKFRFNKILYSPVEYKVLGSNNNRCEIEPNIFNEEKPDYVSLFDNDRSLQYSKIVELRFKNVIVDCSANYSVGLKVSTSDYFTHLNAFQAKPIDPVIYYNLNVMESIKPHFLVTEGI